jgi:hypothetical protein
MSFIINGTSGATFPDSTTQATGVPSPGTAGNVLTSNGTIWTSAAAAAFDSGTRMSFQQTAAPTGWTKDTTAAINDSMLRFVTGSASSGGSVAFSTWAGTTTAGATTLTTPQIPSHTHNATGGSAPPTNPALFQIYTASLQSGGQKTAATAATGGGGSHDHPLSQNLKYYDFIIASKN